MSVGDRWSNPLKPSLNSIYELDRRIFYRSAGGALVPLSHVMPHIYKPPLSQLRAFTATIAATEEIEIR